MKLDKPNSVYHRIIAMAILYGSSSWSTGAIDSMINRGDLGIDLLGENTGYSGVSDNDL
jgi:hypothetical protein